MAAIVQIREKNTASETPTDKTSGTIRFKNFDDAVADLNNPIVRPSPTGTVYSYEKALRLYFGATGPDGSVTSPRAFSDSVNGFGTGVGMKAGVTGSFVTPVSTASTIATGGPTNGFFDYTSGSPLDMDVTHTGSFTGTNTDFGDYLYLQASVADTASAGLSPSEVLTIAYDET